MVHSLCQSCLQSYRLMIVPEEIQLIKQIADETGHLAPCPRLCGGTINLVGEPGIEKVIEGVRLREPLTITGTELYRAVNGAGLPDEVNVRVEVVCAFLESCKVVGVKTETNNGKVYLHELTLDNGVTLHLSAGIKGAEILKMTKGVPHGS